MNTIYDVTSTRARFVILAVISFIRENSPKESEEDTNQIVTDYQRVGKTLSSVVDGCLCTVLENTGQKEIEAIAEYKEAKEELTAWVTVSAKFVAGSCVGHSQLEAKGFEKFLAESSSDDFIKHYLDMHSFLFPKIFSSLAVISKGKVEKLL